MQFHDSITSKRPGGGLVTVRSGAGCIELQADDAGGGAVVTLDRSAALALVGALAGALVQMDNQPALSIDPAAVARLAADRQWLMEKFNRAGEVR